MNKAVRFARENEPELLAKQQEMIEEIKRIRAENNYELYQMYYSAELTRRNQLEKSKLLRQEKELNHCHDGPAF